MTSKREEHLILLTHFEFNHGEHPVAIRSEDVNVVAVSGSLVRQENKAIFKGFGVFDDLRLKLTFLVYIEAFEHLLHEAVLFSAKDRVNGLIMVWEGKTVGIPKLGWVAQFESGEEAERVLPRA